MGNPATTRQPGHQRSFEWYEQRRTGIGSSDAPVIVGVGWGDIHELYLQKLNLAPQPEQNEPMRWGRLLESAVADGYTEMSGNKLRRMNLVQRSREYPWMLASIDRAIVGRRRLVEIKTARFKDDEWGAAGSDQVPDRVRVQVQHQMIVTGYREADVAVLFSGSDLQTFTVGHDQKLADRLVELEATFWGYVQRREPPPRVEQVATLPLPDDAIDADERVTAMVAQLREDRARYAEAKMAKEITEEALKTALDEIAVVKGENFRVTYKPNKDRVEVAWREVARAYRHLLVGHPDLDVIEGVYTRTKPGTRPLIVKWE